MSGIAPSITLQPGDTPTADSTQVLDNRIANPFANFPNRNQDLSRLMNGRQVKRMMRVVRQQPRPRGQRFLELLRTDLLRALR